MCWPGYLEAQVEIACRALASVLTSNAPQIAEWFYVLHLFCSKQQAMNLAQSPEWRLVGDVAQHSTGVSEG